MNRNLGLGNKIGTFWDHFGTLVPFGTKSRIRDLIVAPASTMLIRLKGDQVRCNWIVCLTLNWSRSKTAAATYFFPSKSVMSHESWLMTISPPGAEVGWTGLLLYQAIHNLSGICPGQLLWQRWWLTPFSRVGSSSVCLIVKSLFPCQGCWEYLLMLLLPNLHSKSG